MRQSGREGTVSLGETDSAFTEKLCAVYNVRGSALHSFPNHNTTKPSGFLKCHCAYPETWLRQGNYPFLSPFLIPTCLKRSVFPKSVNQCPRKCFWLPAPEVKEDSSRDTAAPGHPPAGDLHEDEHARAAQSLPRPTAGKHGKRPGFLTPVQVNPYRKISLQLMMFISCSTPGSRGRETQRTAREEDA